MFRLLIFIIIANVLIYSQDLQKEVQDYLDSYNKQYQQLLKEASEAEWKLNTHIVEGDTLTSYNAERANEKFALFTGSTENIEKSRKYLQDKDKLTPLQVRQLESILFFAGSNPEIAKNVVKQKIKVSTEQTKKLYGYDFKVNGRSITPNDIDAILDSSLDLDQRLKVWRESKEVGKELKPGLISLQELRNKSVQALGFSDFFSYQVSEYGMSTSEMMKLTKMLISEIWPLYRELHTWTRYHLAEKYKTKVPDMLPAHWLPDRWGQDWSAIVDVEGVNLDKQLNTKSPEWIVNKGEEFYVSLGFKKLPASFYERSSLYPVDPGAGYKKNTHASAWHMDNENDIRSLMSVQPNANWWETALHELGHIYYFMSYTNKEVPVILRNGANRAFHEAIGSLMGLAATQKPFLQNLNLIQGDGKTDQTKQLLKEALNYFVFIPWSAGVMTEFEHDLYSENLSPDKYNQRWWELKKNYQGIIAPEERGEQYCDAATKTHINDDAAQYYDYALSYVLLFQLHDHISKKILNQDPHATNYWGNKEAGNFLRELMSPGASKDWKELLEEKLGSGLTAKPMLEYFNPLMEYLKKENQGRNYTLPERI